ncbi:uncharacterized protein [Panulirus ornatus]|uniref:uncharacterized protein n=1 Tax=Panulirus ornatus TaxID=150431 RepID=UPI003A83C85F
MAQSVDATCQGLISAHEGSKTMMLTKVTHNGRKCKFPSWLTVHRHWHTLDNSQSYFVYHKNTSLRISNGTAAPLDIETRGHTDLRLVCHKYESQRESHDHGRPPGDHYHRRLPPHTSDDHHDAAAAADDEGHATTLVAHVTVGCKSGYQCVRLYRRDEHVVQVRSGELAFTAEEACSAHYWSPTSANLTTLVAAGGPPGPCGPFGRYHVPDALVPCAGDVPTFTHVTVGCNSDSGNTLQLNARCPEESVLVFHCHGQWESEGVTYVVASPMSRASGAPRRVCFTYSLASSPSSATHTLTLTARHDTCIQRQHDAHIAVNATLAGKCLEVASSISSGSSSSRERLAARVVLHLTLLLLLLLSVPATVAAL